MKYRAQGDATAYATDKSPLNHRILRYADVLLMYAEACNELGDDASARDALNQVRRRAKLDDVTASGKALQSAIRLERRLANCCALLRIGLKPSFRLHSGRDGSGHRNSKQIHDSNARHKNVR